MPTVAGMLGLQVAFLNPALALLLVALYRATPAEVGWALAIYNASGFVAALLVPAWADRRHDYLRPLLGCELATLALAGALAATSVLPVAVAALVVLGGPAGVSATLLFAQLKHAGATSTEVVHTRAVVSLAWIAGPPLATLLIGWFGSRSVLVALAVVTVAGAASVAVLVRTEGRAAATDERAPVEEDGPPVSPVGVVVVVAAFVALQATNAAAVSVMGLYVTDSLGLDVLWAGIALGVAAGLEIPALLLTGRLSRRFGDLTLIAWGSVAGVAYYAGMAAADGPVPLIGLQVLNAVFFAAVAGPGLTLFQRIIPRPGMAAGLYFNARRLGAIASGPLIGLAAVSSLGYRVTFVAGAGLTAGALVAIAVLARRARSPRPVET